MKSVFFLAAAACYALTTASVCNAQEIFDHNGSKMLVDYDAGTIVYHQVKKSLQAFISSGSVVFKGGISKGKGASGEAFVFRKGCEPAAYEVAGRYDKSVPGYVLKGSAPIRSKTGCDILGYDSTSKNSRLVFVDIAEKTRLSSLVSSSEDDPTPEEALEYLKAAFECAEDTVVLTTTGRMLRKSKYVGDSSTFSIESNMNIIDASEGDRRSSEINTSKFSELGDVEVKDKEVEIYCRAGVDCWHQKVFEDEATLITVPLCDAAMAQDLSVAMRVLIKAAETP